MNQNQKDRALIETIRRSPSSASDPSTALDGLVAMVMQMYGQAIQKDVLFHSHIGLIPREEIDHAEQLVALNLIALIRHRGEALGRLTVRQLLHLLTVQVALSFQPGTREVPSDYQIGLRYQWIEPPWKSTDLQTSSVYEHSFNSLLTTITGGLLPNVSHPQHFILRQQNIVFEGDEVMTAQFLSSVLMPYVGAIADMQRVCNAVMRRPHREVVVKSISQNSPTSIKLIDAAQAINALKEDIIPWRRENAQSLAMLKELEVAADIKKKEEEALEIRARATKDEAEAEKIRAEAAKAREEAEQLRIENDRRRFELKKAKLELALDIVSKIQPDLPPADKYIHAMQLLPSIDDFAASPIEPSLLTS